MQQKKEALNYHYGTALKASVMAHFLRVGLNRASVNTSFLQTLKEIPTYFFKGMVFNFIRGSLTAGLQSHVNYTAKKQIVNPIAGQFVGLGAAMTTGTLVSLFTELPFMRFNSGAKSINTELFKFNKPIVEFIMLRELGFSSAVLMAKDLPPFAHYSILFVAAWMSAACHKLTMIEATKKYSADNFTRPDYAKGLKPVFVSLSKGEYTHPALKAPYANPYNFFQRSANLMLATCGPNMFVWRLAYLAVFSELLSTFKKRAERDGSYSLK